VTKHSAKTKKQYHGKAPKIWKPKDGDIAREVGGGANEKRRGKWERPRPGGGTDSVKPHSIGGGKSGTKTQAKKGKIGTKGGKKTRE